MERIRQQMTSEPEPPPKAVKRYPIYHIIRTLLERDPTDRYLSAVDALTEIEAIDGAA